MLETLSEFFDILHLSSESQGWCTVTGASYRCKDSVSLLIRTHLQGRIDTYGSFFDCLSVDRVVGLVRLFQRQNLEAAQHDWADGGRDRVHFGDLCKHSVHRPVDSRGRIPDRPYQFPKNLAGCLAGILAIRGSDSHELRSIANPSLAGLGFFDARGAVVDVYHWPRRVLGLWNVGAECPVH